MNNDLEHAAQLVAAFALRLPAGQLTFGKAARLAYVADRECMRRHGFPIIDDIRVATNGALNFKVLRAAQHGCNPLVSGHPLFSEIGEACFTNPALGIDDLDLFSVADNAVLNHVVATWGEFDIEDLDRKMRDEFSELSHVEVGTEIGEKEIFAALGSEDPEGDAERLQSFRRVDQLFEIASLPGTP